MGASDRDVAELRRARFEVDREERRIEFELKRHRKIAGAIVAEVADHVASTPTPRELVELGQALEAAARAQRSAADALLNLARVRVDRLRAELQDDPEEDLGTREVH